MATDSTTLRSRFDDKVLLFRNLGKGKFQDVTAETGLTPRNRPSGITFVDYDHDGDLDLFLTGEALKAGDRAQRAVAQQRQQDVHRMDRTDGLGGSGKTAAAILTDFNNDRAVDLAVTGDSAAPCFSSIRAKGNIPRSLCMTKKLPPTQGIAVLDYNKDGWMDIAVTHAGAPGRDALAQRAHGPNNAAAASSASICRCKARCAAGALRPIDIDNDGWVDLAAIVETAAGPQVRVFRNRGDGSFEDVSHALGLDAIKLQVAARPDCCRCGGRRRGRSDRDAARMRRRSCCAMWAQTRITSCASI